MSFALVSFLLWYLCFSCSDFLMGNIATTWFLNSTLSLHYWTDISHRGSIPATGGKKVTIFTSTAIVPRTVFLLEYFLIMLYYLGPRKEFTFQV